MKLFTITCLCIAFQIHFGFAQEPVDVSAKINLQKEDVYAKIDIFVNNNNFRNYKLLNYQVLTLTRHPKNNNFKKNTQQGEFTLLPNEQKTVGSFKINVQTNEELKMYLFVKDNKQVIAQDSLVFQDIDKLLQVNAVKETDIGLKGLVVENVVTKFGKDFNDYFYQYYLQQGANYPFIIHINEKPFMGRGSLLSLVVDDETVFEFQGKPDDEYLQNAAKHALKLVNEFSKTRQTVEKSY